MKVRPSDIDYADLVKLSTTNLGPVSEVKKNVRTDEEFLAMLEDKGADASACSEFLQKMSQMPLAGRLYAGLSINSVVLGLGVLVRGHDGSLLSEKHGREVFFESALAVVDKTIPDAWLKVAMLMAEIETAGAQKLVNPESDWQKLWEVHASVETFVCAKTELLCYLVFSLGRQDFPMHDGPVMTRRPYLNEMVIGMFESIMPGFAKVPERGPDGTVTLNDQADKLFKLYEHSKATLSNVPFPLAPPFLTSYRFII